jgi:hypothetical protein
MKTITERLQQMLLDDERPLTTIAKAHGRHQSVVSEIITGKQFPEIGFAAEYLEACGMRLSLGAKYTGHPTDQLREAITDSGMTVTQIHRAAKIDICTVRAVIQGARKPHMRTVEALAAALGLEWIFLGEA